MSDTHEEWRETHQEAKRETRPAGKWPIGTMWSSNSGELWIVTADGWVRLPLGKPTQP